MTTRSWQVGEVTVTRVVEPSAVRTPEFGYRNLTTEQILEQSWLRPHFATEDGRLKSCIQAFIVETGGEKIIVDTCVGNDKVRANPAWHEMAGPFLDDLAAAGAPAESIDTGALHPFTCGPCGLEHAPGRRPVGSDLRQRALSFRGGGLFVEAKSNRQVIMVTHNANLVVNTDADQIIIAEAGPHPHGALPPISYRSGGLENAEIRKAVCDILEGGEGAFQERARRLRVRLVR